MNSDGVSGKLMASYIIQAALYLSLCVLSLVGFYAAWSVSAVASSSGVLDTRGDHA